MRIIGGHLKSRRIAFPKLKNAEALTRPTTDFARESLFNLLQNWRPLDEIESPLVLDLFAGTGAVGIEFISRGAERVDFVEKSPICMQSIQEHAKSFDIQKNCQFHKADVFAFLRSCTNKYDYIFADPPYGLPALGKLPELIFESGLLLPTGLLVVEHDDRFSFDKCPYWVESRHYGKSRFSFFEYRSPDGVELSQETPQIEA